MSKDGAQPKEAPAPDLSGRAEQLGQIIVKTLDLAEAGLSLGITVLSRAGTAAQEALNERAPAQAPPNVNVADGRPEPALEDDEGFFLTNRLPLAPGGDVQVSFSITNDSLVEPKRVHLRVEGLLGEQREARIDADAFAVRPMRKSIAPMDFEKFVLTGTLPADAPPDVYLGSVIVGSTDEMSIPVRLVVGAA
jgi:hypothetical protein